MTDPSRVETGPISIANLVAWAYQVSPKEVDGPGWMRDAWFEVVATFPNGAGGKAPEMLRHLLADRFKLVAHVDKRTESVFALTAPNGDGKLTRTADETTESACKPKGITDGDFRKREGARECLNVSMQQLAELLPSSIAPYDVDRLVLDRTALSGGYDFIIRWTPAIIRDRVPADVTPGDSMPEALKKLGLQLESQKAEVSVVVVDSVEKEPTGN